ncbi:hypothetical protein A3P32_02735 [Lactobacillus johnsonii]|nr:hypothetical protein A3P31_09805 [Lactobacillus johnsonii]ARW76250.1 hypothetical protein A3P32_02735 [Lactobacillus johnsonii]
MVINILSNRSEWTFYFLSSVQFNFTIGEILLISRRDQFQIIKSCFYIRFVVIFTLHKTNIKLCILPLLSFVFFSSFGIQ